MISVPYHPKFHERMTEAGDAEVCIVCGRIVTNSRYQVHLWYGSDFVTEEEAATLDPSGEGGYWSIGSDCLRKLSPEDRAKYVTKVAHD